MAILSIMKIPDAKAERTTDITLIANNFPLTVDRSFEPVR